MTWQDGLSGDPLGWLVAHEEPALRYLTLRHLLDYPADDPRLLAARAAAHRAGAISLVLENMQPEGFWARPGPGYGPKYHSTVWALILLAQMGGSAEEDARIRRACGYYLDHSLAVDGQISYSGAPGGTFDCLQGNMVWALVTLGCDDPRLEMAVDWMARSNTGEGVAPRSTHAKDLRATTLRYYAYKSGPDFACGADGDLACAWGAAKVMLAIAALPAALRTPLAERAATRGADFLFSVPLETAVWPSLSGKTSGNYWKFGFPVFYVTDLLQIAGAMVGLGYGKDARMAALLDLIRAKRDADGRWPLEYSYSTKTWGSYGRVGKPNPWVTLRALRVLKAAEA
jgi:hypothetical protein